MVKKFCPNCKEEVDAKIINVIWTPCDGNPLECPKCGGLLWKNNSPVESSETGEMIFHKSGKFFSKNEKGEMKLIQIA